MMKARRRGYNLRIRSLILNIGKQPLHCDELNRLSTVELLVMANQVLVPQSDVLKKDIKPPKFLIPETEESVWHSLKDSIRDVLFPEKLPPLRLTSQPVRVKSIWGAYDNKRTAATSSLIIHSLMLAGLIGFSIYLHRVTTQDKPQETVTLVAPDVSEYLPMSTKPMPAMGGGGGGGEKAKIVAPKGKLPKQALQQITPPMVQVRNEAPKLPVEPTVVVPPTVKLPTSSLPNLGDPKSSVAGPLSSGVGSGGGIGSGSGGGVGSGTGAGVGPGIGGGIGGGVYRVGGGVSAPSLIKKIEPEYSEEARKAKYQGVVVLGLVVDSQGRPKDLRVQKSLGMGLDQKALEAVRQWVFEPAHKDGKPVPVLISVEVAFRLF
jgi:periplasmic protein TonB